LFFVPQLAATIIWADGVSSSFSVGVCFSCLLVRARAPSKQEKQTTTEKELDTLVLFLLSFGAIIYDSGSLACAGARVYVYVCMSVRVRICTRTDVYTHTRTRLRARCL